MRDVKKILEMRSQNFSQRKIAEALKVSRDTVRKVYKAADENNICCHEIHDVTENVYTHRNLENLQTEMIKVDFFLDNK